MIAPFLGSITFLVDASVPKPGSRPKKEEEIPRIHPAWRLTTETSGDVGVGSQLWRRVYSLASHRQAAFSICVSEAIQGSIG